MKKKVFYTVSIVIFSIVVSCSTKNLSKKGIYQEVDSKAYEEILKKEEANIIDVRTASEFNKSHIKGAVNASYFSGKFLKMVSANEFDKEKTTLIYCETQHRSPMAARRLHKLGFKKIIDLRKGMRIWRKEGFSYETNNSKIK